MIASVCFNLLFSLVGNVIANEEEFSDKNIKLKSAEIRLIDNY